MKPMFLRCRRSIGNPTRLNQHARSIEDLFTDYFYYKPQRETQ